MLRDRINEIAKYFINSIMNLTPQPYEIQWNKLFQIEGQEHLDVEIRDTTDLFDDTW